MDTTLRVPTPDAVPGLESLLPALLTQHLPTVHTAYLFGSQARGEALPSSDIDVAVMCAQPLSALERFDAQERLAAELDRDVDLVDLRQASTVLRMQVLRDGRLLVDHAPDQRERAEVAWISEYSDLSIWRAGILADWIGPGRARGGEELQHSG